MLEKKNRQLYQKHIKKSRQDKSKTPAHKNAKIKKKLGLFYKIILSILLIFSIVLSYFVVLVSTAPKSFPFVTKEIKSSLSKNFGREVFLDKSYLSFTRYGTLKVSVTNVKFFYRSALNVEKQEFVIPKLESEFSLLNFLFLNFNPSKIKIINPEIVINNVDHIRIDSTEVAEEENSKSQVIEFLASVRDGKLPIKNFEIENAKLIIKKEEINTEILIQKSQIRTDNKDNILHISSINKLNFDDNKNDVELKSNCALASDNILKCDVALANFDVKSLSKINSKLAILNQIDATLNISSSFVINSEQANNFIFKVEAKRANLDFPNFFGEKVKLSDLSINGEYNSNLGILNLSEIKADFFDANSFDEAQEILITNKKNKKTKSNFQYKPPITDGKATIAMSLMTSDLRDKLNNKLDFYINIKNIKNDEMEKFWPKYLSHNGIRDWVITNIKGGKIKDAYAKFTLQTADEKTELTTIDAQMAFAGLSLEYDKSFPKITNIDGVAKFNEKSMKILISAADVLNTKISEAQVGIDDFMAPIVMLNISGKSLGSAADSLKHASSDLVFQKEVEKYLNGNSQNNFDVRIPLQENINLKHCYIAINSSISALNNDYMKGDMMVDVKKDFASNNFNVALDLTKTDLSIKAFDIEKKSAIESGLNLTISFDRADSTLLKNVSLWKKEIKQEKKKQTINLAKISGNAEFATAPFLITALDIKNNNFGKNNYLFSYTTDKKTSSVKISLKGDLFNLAPFIESEFLSSSSDSKFSNSKIQLAVNKVLMASNKSLQGLYVALNCKSNFCYNGLVKALYNKKQSINLTGLQKPKEDFVSWNGEITDVGYLAEGLGISNKISAGDAKIELTQKIIDKNSVLAGKIKINNDITIYENARFKRLATNDLFLKIKDKIFSNDKTTFNSLKLEFEFKNKVFDIKTLIASNYKIGITAKGFIDFKDDVYEIKGMIVPGFIVNNLFGIGNIPILGSVVSGLLTGGEGGGLFGIHYEYIKKKGQKEATFETNKVSAFVPTTIRNLFDAI